MSEKRILCTEVEEKCQYLLTIESQLHTDDFECEQGLYCCKNTGWKPITEDACKNCKEGRYQGSTREQTIYKMAKALCKMDYTECSECSECAFKDKPNECKAFLKSSDFYEQAEVALNAVLEINNNE